MKSTRVRVTLAVVAAGVALTACSPSQAGAAAIVGDQRISVSELSADAKEYEAAMDKAGISAAQLQLPGSVPQALLESKVFISQLNQLGARNGITVTPAEIEALLAQALQQQQGMTLDQLAVSATVAPSELRELVRASVIQQKLMAKFGAGQDQASQQAANQKLAQEAQKAVPVTRSPRYGEPNPQGGGLVESNRFGALPGASQ
ncbi:SurA N-terminal domain-containing protein [Planobispora rosea]|uniref:SurA N-terminal domain-containing protein n=1 Tax=Planobispora rosea TaxID=35762 RepID=UPI00159F0EF2|nr:SurA N-terminal domain-containing protein [Planobispora rosea]